VAGQLDQFNRTIRNLYAAVFERPGGPTDNRVPTAADLHYTQQLSIHARNRLGLAIANDVPEIWLRLNDQLLDYGAMNNRYVDSAALTRVWVDNKAALWSASPTWTTTPRVQSVDGLIDGRPNSSKRFQGIAGGTAYYILSTSLPPTQNFTVEFLMKVISVPGGSWVGGGLLEGVTTTGAGLLLDSNGTTIRLRGEPGALVAGALTIGQLHHCAFVRDYEGTNRLYLDGVEVANEDGSVGSSSFTVPWRIYGGDASLVFEMEEAAMYRTALTAAQIAAHYAAFAEEENAVGSSYAPLARYYEALTPSGADGANDSSMALYSDKVSYSSAVLHATLMWGIIRIRPNYASTAGTDRTIFDWRVDANNRVTLHFNQATDSFVLTRLNAGAGATASVVTAHAAYDYITIAFKLSATQISISLNGGAWTDVANTAIPTMTTALNFSLYMTNVQYILWSALGVGTLTDAGLAAVHAKGNADPDISDFGDAVLNEISFLWHGRGTAHVPIGAWGESMYE
jgi:hypothetical protein